ncbi:MAG: tRNA dihydrouridine synthase [Oligoflexales bacterium]
MTPSRLWNLVTNPNAAILAPLAGVSDFPFRLTCTRHGAALTYVEMISATALVCKNVNTQRMLARHPAEDLLGVQITGKSSEETARAVEILDKTDLETIDINMGCPVRKIVNNGCGAAILKDVKRVHETVRLCRDSTSKPLSVKIRLGWDKTQINGKEIALAAEDAGAEWVTVHGRTRSCTYADPVDLETIAEIKAALRIPVIGNGNVLTAQNAAFMKNKTGVDLVMVSRGALGNPWLFDALAGYDRPLSVSDWFETLEFHMKLHWESYGIERRNLAAVTMRKHLLWYLKGWPNSKEIKAKIQATETYEEAKKLIAEFTNFLYSSSDPIYRAEVGGASGGTPFTWDPKFEMDRDADRPLDL